MNLSSILLTFVLFVLFSVSNISSAHIVEETNNIQTTIHISPNDKPIANKESEITFEVEDSSNGFEFKNCNCLVQIYQNQNLIDSLSLTTSKIKYTFPHEGLFDIKLIASSTSSENTFNSFESNFTYEVFRENDEETEPPISPTDPSSSVTSHGSSHNSYYIVASFAALFLGISLVALFRNIKTQ